MRNLFSRGKLYNLRSTLSGVNKNSVSRTNYQYSVILDPIQWNCKNFTKKNLIVNYISLLSESTQFLINSQIYDYYRVSAVSVKTSPDQTKYSPPPDGWVYLKSPVENIEELSTIVRKPGAKQIRNDKKRTITIPIKKTGNTWYKHVDSIYSDNQSLIFRFNREPSETNMEITIKIFIEFTKSESKKQKENADADIIGNQGLTWREIAENNYKVATSDISFYKEEYNKLLEINEENIRRMNKTNSQLLSKIQQLVAQVKQYELQIKLLEGGHGSAEKIQYSDTAQVRQESAKELLQEISTSTKKENRGEQEDLKEENIEELPVKKKRPSKNQRKKKKKDKEKVLEALAEDKEEDLE